MWVIASGVIAAAIFAGGYMVNKWSDRTVGINYIHNKQFEASTNILQYTSLAIDLVDIKNYKNMYLNNAEILGLVTSSKFNLLGDYKSSITNFGNGQYLVVSWNKFNNSNINVASTTSALVKNISNKVSLSGASNTFLVKTDGSCNSMSLLNNYTGDFTKKKVAYQSLVQNICTSLPSGYQIGLYNLIIQVR